MTADPGPLPVRWRRFRRAQNVDDTGLGPALARHLDDSLEAAGWFAVLVEPARDTDRCGSGTRNSGWWYQAGATVKCPRLPLDPHLLSVRHVGVV